MSLARPTVTWGQSLATSDLPEEAVRLIAAALAEKSRRTPAQQKMSSQLLHEQRMQRGTTIAGDASLRRTIQVAPDGMVVVDIRATVTPDVLARIETSGGTVIDAVPAGNAIRARLPLDVIETIAGLSEVQFIRQADDQPPVPQGPPVQAGGDQQQNVGALKVNTSEGDVAHRAALARALYGVTGANIGIGVLSNGADSREARRLTGDLPEVTVVAGQNGAGDQGTAMLEIVHDLAPGARLFFATSSVDQTQLKNNIVSLCTAGAKVIVDGGSFVTQPTPRDGIEYVFQDGVVAEGVNTAVGNGCIYFAAAGNAGNKNDGTSGVWEGDFVAGAQIPGLGGTPHNFGGTNTNQITGDTTGQLTLQWSDEKGQSSNDYDLFVFNANMTLKHAESTNVQNGTQDPIEAINSVGWNDVNNRIVVVLFSGAARYLHVNTNGGRLGNSTAGQIGGRAAARNAIAVAAVNVATAGGGAFSGGTANPIQTSSSDGGRRIFYQPNGTPITPGNFSSTGGELVQKPDVAAADCVVTATPNFAPFCGGAAAAAHAAGIAALMLEAVPSLTRTDLLAAMTARAMDIEAAGVDRDSGAGLVDAIGAVGRTHPPFADHPLVAGSSVVKAAHISQLRNRVNALRIRCGLPEASFTDPVLTAGMFARGYHVTELRASLAGAYAACGVTAPTYTDSTLIAGSTVVKAAHLAELRAAIVALE